MVTPLNQDSTPPKPNTAASLIKDDQIETIVARQALLRDFESSNLTKKEFVRSRGLSRSTFNRYLSRRREGGFKALIDRRKNRPKTGIKMDDRFTEIILEYLVEHPKAPITAIRTELTKQASAQGWGNAPSYHKVRRFCKGIAPDVLYQWSEGRKARVEDKPEFHQVDRAEALKILQDEVHARAPYIPSMNSNRHLARICPTLLRGQAEPVYSEEALRCYCATIWPMRAENLEKQTNAALQWILVMARVAIGTRSLIVGE